MATSSGGQNFQSPTASTNLSRAIITGLDFNNESYYFVVRAADQYENEDNNTVELSTLTILCGDATNNGVIDVGDVVYLIKYLFRSGPLSQSTLCAGDCNGDGNVDVSDIVFFVNYLFRSGPTSSGCC